MKYPLLSDARLEGKRVLLRAGFDVPIENGEVKDTARIEAMLPTIKYILDHGASLVIMAHQGRPSGEVVPDMSQKPLVPVLEKLLGTPVDFASSCVGDEASQKAARLKPGQVLLLENLRFHAGEKKKDPDFVKALAALGEVYVNDAFTNCHRDHASMTDVAKALPSFLGLNAQQEVEHLSKVLHEPQRPVTLIVSGAKMETKVPIIERFLSKGDDILLGGCIANTFIAARGFDIGMSKYEPEFDDKAREIMLESEKEEKAMVHVPRDVVVASEPSEDAEKIDLPVEDIEGDMAIFDIGKVTIDRYVEVILKSKTIVWNGPLGLYELNRFSHATKRIAEAIVQATEAGAVSIIGGGDTLDFHDRYGYDISKYTFVSTAGGAMLEFIGGKRLPALEALRKD